jgi:protein SCO1
MRSGSRAIAATIAVAALVSGCGGADGAGSGEQAQSNDSPSGQLTSSRFSGTLASPRRLAPPLELQDSIGDPVDLREFRGDAVIVTFVYVNCPDVCPLILDNLRAAQIELGVAGDDVQMLAVSVDPEGDTPEAVYGFLAAHRILDRIPYLIGSRAELERVWHDWGIVSQRSPRRNDPDYVEHSAMVYGIDASGRITTLYPSSFKPEEIAHDVPLLAAQ